MKDHIEEEIEQQIDLFNPANKHARPTAKLLSLFGLLDRLGWLIASEDPNKADTFELRDLTKQKFDVSTLSRQKLENYLSERTNTSILHRSDHLIIWRELVPIPRPNTSLSKRELEVHELLLAGETLPSIANELGISQRTVEKHVEHIYKKRNVKSYNELLFSNTQDQK